MQTFLFAYLTELLQIMEPEGAGVELMCCRGAWSYSVERFILCVSTGLAIIKECFSNKSLVFVSEEHPAAWCNLIQNHVPENYFGPFDCSSCAFTEHGGPCDVSDSCSGEDGFEPWSQHWLSWLRNFVLFLCPLRQLPGHVEIGHDWCFPFVFELIIYWTTCRFKLCIV
jgi:hypothetical protein